MGWIIIGIPLLIFTWTCITQPLLLAVCVVTTAIIWCVFGAFDDLQGEDLKSKDDMDAASEALAAGASSDADKKEDK